MSSIKPLLQPKSVAVVGASSNPAKLGHIVLKNILEGGFAGKTYAVNPKGEAILGVPTFPSARKLPKGVDLAVLAIPAEAVVEAARACGQAGVKSLIVISAGFSELGDEGAKREQQLVATAKKYGMRLLGPNCLGLVDPPNKLNASFAGAMPAAGHVAVLSQSGAICTAILDWAKLADVGFSRFVSIGNQTDVDAGELLEQWTMDKQTNLVLGYLEGLGDGRELLAKARQLTKRKPFILVKAGATGAGAAAVSSHTGSLTGSDQVLDAALRDAGVTRAHSVGELFDYTEAFANLSLPKGKRVAVVTNAGGPGVLATDSVSAAGLEMAKLAPATVRKLQKALPAEANVHNPVDCIGDARADRYRLALEAVTKDPGVDAVVVLLTPQAMTDVPGTADAIIKTHRSGSRPILAAFMGGKTVQAGLDWLRRAGVPAYPTPERAIEALAAVNRYSQYRGTPSKSVARAAKPPVAAAKVMAKFKGHDEVGGSEAAQLVTAYGINTPSSLFSKDLDEALANAKIVHYPVVMKIDSPDILHKTDAGGVISNIFNPDQLREAHATMLKTVKRKKPKARIRGVRINPMLPEGLDFIVGAKRDPAFGPVVVFGYGGIYVEIMKDIAFGLAPVNRAQAADIVAQTKSAGLFSARGQGGYDLDGLYDTIVAVSRMITEFDQISEIDLNPLRVSVGSVCALDVRIILR